MEWNIVDVIDGKKNYFEDNIDFLVFYVAKLCTFDVFEIVKNTEIAGNTVSKLRHLPDSFFYFSKGHYQKCLSL